MNDPFAPGTHAFAPLYKEVRKLLTQSLADGEWKPGEALPSESKLSQRFHVAIGTVRRAIDELVAEHILVRQQGRGTFVATHTPKRMLYRFFHIVGEDGCKEFPESEMVAFTRDRADEEEAKRLNLLPGARVIRIVNLQHLGGKCRSRWTTWCSRTIASPISPRRFCATATTRIIPSTRRATESMWCAPMSGCAPRSATGTRRSCSGSKAGTPLLEINRTAMTYHNTPVELRRSLVNTAAHEYWNDLGKPDPQP